MITDYFVLALSNLKHRGLRSWLTILGVFIGIAAVVSLISLGQGLQSAITGQFSTLSVDRLTIQNAETGLGPPGSTAIKKLTEHDLDLVKSVPGTINVLGRFIRIASFEYNRVRSFGYISDIPTDQKMADYVYESGDFEVEDGKLLKSNDKGKVLLGNDFATKDFDGKKLRVGSKVSIQGKEFVVAGILKKASSFQLNSVIFMPQDDLKNILNIGDEWDIIVAQVRDKNQIEKVASDIEKKFRKDRNEKEGEEDFSVQTPLQSLGTVNLILNIINIIITGIAAISLLVGGVGIANSMFTSVLERKKQIGVMKAIGAENSDILAVFLIESGLIGLIGGIVGVLLGLGFAFAVSGIANSAFGTEIINVMVSYPLIGGALAFSFLIGIISGIIPAIQASHLKPTEALRG